MNDLRPVIGITMGDPAGIGPEIVLTALKYPEICEGCRPLILGDFQILRALALRCDKSYHINRVSRPEEGKYTTGSLDIINLSDLDPGRIILGKPAARTGKAMLKYIHKAVDMAMEGLISAMVTCPINKESLHLSGADFSGHTELIAHRTACDDYAMMLAGKRIRVVLVTIHIPVKNISSSLSEEKILKTIELTHRALKNRFGINAPKIAVAGLNPHAGEAGIFGNEEKQLIEPAVLHAKNKGFRVHGPFPADTLFYHAVDGDYDAVICMYHDQGLIPFKMVHFKDGVNTTIGLPIIRTSVDHGTAYDIVGTGKADPGSLIAAIKMAAEQAKCVK